MADAPDSKSGVLRDVGVQLPPPAPLNKLKDKNEKTETGLHIIIYSIIAFGSFDRIREQCRWRYGWRKRPAIHPERPGRARGLFLILQGQTGFT